MVNGRKTKEKVLLEYHKTTYLKGIRPEASTVNSEKGKKGRKKGLTKRE